MTVLDMRDVSSFCDYFIILTATSSPHIRALAKSIQEDLDTDGIKTLSNMPSAVESGWVVLDYGGCIVHIFDKQTREFYSLERLWSDAKKIRVSFGRTVRKKVK